MSSVGVGHNSRVIDLNFLVEDYFIQNQVKVEFVPINGRKSAKMSSPVSPYYEDVYFQYHQGYYREISRSNLANVINSYLYEHEYNFTTNQMICAILAYSRKKFLAEVEYDPLIEGMKVRIVVKKSRGRPRKDGTVSTVVINR